MRKEFPNHRYNMQIESVLGPTLNHLLRNGVTKEDIINMNELVTDFANNEFFFEPQSEKNTADKDATTVIRDRTVHWKRVIGSLRKFGNINSKIREQNETLEKKEKQVSELENRKQELEANHKETSLLLDYKCAQVSYLDGLAKHFINDIKRNFSAASFRPSMLFINIICIYSDRGDKMGDQNKTDKK